jgi:hypothetical protein
MNRPQDIQGMSEGLRSGVKPEGGPPSPMVDLSNKFWVEPKVHWK